LASGFGFKAVDADSRHVCGVVRVIHIRQLSLQSASHFARCRCRLVRPLQFSRVMHPLRRKLRKCFIWLLRVVGLTLACRRLQNVTYPLSPGLAPKFRAGKQEAEVCEPISPAPTARTAWASPTKQR
jgi:hypothetical protein